MLFRVPQLAYHIVLPICLDEVQQHVNDARDALNDGKLIEAGSELDIVSNLLDQLDDMTSKSD